MIRFRKYKDRFVPPIRLPSACRYEPASAFEHYNIVCKVNGRDVEMKECHYILGHGAVCKDNRGKEYYFPDTIFPVDTSEENKVESRILQT